MKAAGFLVVVLGVVLTKEVTMTRTSAVHRSSPPILRKPSMGEGATVDLSAAASESHADAFLPQQSLALPQVTSVDVRCTKKSLNVRLQFDTPFRGVVYSKGYFGDPRCRHVEPRAVPTAVVQFTMQADRCGTALVERGPRSSESFIENTIVVQNEVEIQDASDTARKLRCSWDGHVDRTVSSSLHVDALDVLSARYAGSSADTFMDVQLGRGPFASPVSGLVKIGDTLTVVVYALGHDVDIYVKDCIAHDGDASHALQLTDVQGCVLKPKLLGPWQKTRRTGATGASGMAFAYLKAFKFPDKVEVYLECNVEICSRRCSEMCKSDKSHTNIDAYQKTKRSTRDHGNGTLELGKMVGPVHVTREIRVVAPEDLYALEDGDVNGTGTHPIGTVKISMGDICMSIVGFVTCLSAVLTVLLSSCVLTAMLFLRIRQLLPAAQIAGSFLNGAPVLKGANDIMIASSECKVSRRKSISC